MYFDYFSMVSTCIILLCHKWLRCVYAVSVPFRYSLQVPFSCYTTYTNIVPTHIYNIYIYFTSFWNPSLFTFYRITLHYIQRNPIDFFSKPDPNQRLHTRCTCVLLTVRHSAVFYAIRTGSNFYFTRFLSRDAHLEHLFLILSMSKNC